MDIKKTISIFLIAAITVIAAVIFTITAVRALWYNPEEQLPPPPDISQTEREPVSAALYPVRLVIPSLAIDTSVEFAGVNKHGNMTAPSNFANVSWYQYGTVPGQTGSAVMAGHADNGFGFDGVFKHLDRLRAGDEFYIVTKGGERLRFVVSDIRSYPYNAVPADEIFAQNDAARLNLITCIGSWISQAETYDKRLIIFARLEENS